MDHSAVRIGVLVGLVTGVLFLLPAGVRAGLTLALAAGLIAGLTVRAVHVRRALSRRTPNAAATI